jgi:hypothetical protein
MLSKLLRKLRPRSVYDVMAAIACFGVLAGGTAYAAHTVRSTDIVDGEVKSADVKDQSLTTFDVSTFLGADIVDGSLTGADVQDNSLTGADIDESTLSSLSNVVVREGTQITLPANTSVTASASCNPGEVATGGGFRGDSDPQYFGSLRHSLPVPDDAGSTPTGWQVVVRGGTQSHVTTAYVICAKAG